MPERPDKEFLDKKENDDHSGHETRGGDFAEKSGNGPRVGFGGLHVHDNLPSSRLALRKHIRRRALGVCLSSLKGALPRDALPSRAPEHVLVPAHRSDGAAAAALRRLIPVADAFY